MGPSKKAGDEPAPPGNWLVRQDALVIGPVSGAQVVQKLYAGEVDGRSEISLMGSGVFQRLSEVDAFKLQLAKSQAKLRVDAHATVEAKKGRASRNMKIGGVAAVALLVAGGMAVAMQQLAVRAPWKNTDELAYADLIEVEAPIITRAKARADDEELVDYPGGPKSPKTPGRPPGLPKNATASRTDKPPVPGSTAKSPPKPTTETDSDGLEMAKFDQDAINSVVRAKQRTLFPCLAAEAQKEPGLSTKIPIEFVIGNDGHVAKVWVDHPKFKEGTLPECLLRELQKWPFKPYEGERATVGLSFKLGKTG